MPQAVRPISQTVFFPYDGRVALAGSGRLLLTRHTCVAHGGEVGTIGRCERCYIHVRSCQRSSSKPSVSAGINWRVGVSQLMQRLHDVDCKPGYALSLNPPHSSDSASANAISRHQKMVQHCRMNGMSNHGRKYGGAVVKHETFFICIIHPRTIFSQSRTLLSRHCGQGPKAGRFIHTILDCHDCR